MTPSQSPSLRPKRDHARDRVFSKKKRKGSTVPSSAPAPPQQNLASGDGLARLAHLEDTRRDEILGELEDEAVATFGGWKVVGGQRDEQRFQKDYMLGQVI